MVSELEDLEFDPSHIYSVARNYSHIQKFIQLDLRSTDQ
jgi:hypothetical protein